MTRTTAIAGARALQERADAGWVGGYDPITVKAMATRLLRVLDQAARTPAEARALVEAVEAVEMAW